MSRLVFVFSVFAAWLIVGCSMAFADGAPAVVVATPPTLWTLYILPILESAASAAVTVGISWIALKVHQKTGIDVSQKWQDDLHRAADTGIQAALSKAGVAVAADMSSNTKLAAVGEAMKWVNTSVPDALAGLGVTPAEVRTVVEAKLNGIVTANASPALPSTPAATPATGT